LARDHLFKLLNLQKGTQTWLMKDVPEGWQRAQNVKNGLGVRVSIKLMVEVHAK